MIGSTRRAAAFAAGLAAPGSYEPSLLPRTAAQQGLVTGLAATATYATAGVLLTAADRMTAGTGAPRPLLHALGVGVGLALQAGLPQRPAEPLWRATTRTAGFELSLASASGLASAALSAGAPRPAGPWRDAPAGLLTAATAALTTLALRSRPTGIAVTGEGAPHRRPDRLAAVAPLGTSLLAAGGVATTAQVLAAGERQLARGANRALARLLPGPPGAWTGTGRAVAAGLTAVAASRGLQAGYTRIEAGAARAEPGLDSPPADPFVSGGPRSAIPFAALSREGRRHVVTRTRAQHVERVMGDLAHAEPVRVYVPLASAATVAERVAVALDEIDRLGALDRSLLLLVSPTGTGYVNYAAVEAVEYLARGDVATVTMQYSVRPSFLSLDRVRLGREQNVLLWVALRERLAATTADRRPRAIMFGESLGAHTSQDAVLHQGGAGLERLGIDSAVWVGTPFGSGWRDEVLGPDRTAEDERLVRVYSGLDDYRAQPESARAGRRYVLVTHDDDGVARFGLPLLVQSPSWLQGGRRPGVPAAMRWQPVTTFLQVFVDMLNGSDSVPGQFAARGHDYRADLVEIVASTYRLPASAELLRRVTAALQELEKGFADFRVGMAEADRTARQPGARPTSPADPPTAARP